MNFRKILHFICGKQKQKHRERSGTEVFEKIDVNQVRTPRQRALSVAARKLARVRLGSERAIFWFFEPFFPNIFHTLSRIVFQLQQCGRVTSMFHRMKPGWPFQSSLRRPPRPYSNHKSSIANCLKLPIRIFKSQFSSFSQLSNPDDLDWFNSSHTKFNDDVTHMHY